MRSRLTIAASDILRREYAVPYSRVIDKGNAGSRARARESKLARARAKRGAQRVDCDYVPPQFKCPFDKCGQLFVKKFSMERHVKHHTGERPHKCVVCGRSFSEKSTLKVRFRFCLLSSLPRFTVSLFFCFALNARFAVSLFRVVYCFKCVRHCLMFGLCRDTKLSTWYKWQQNHPGGLRQ